MVTPTLQKVSRGQVKTCVRVKGNVSTPQLCLYCSWYLGLKLCLCNHGRQSAEQG